MTPVVERIQTSSGPAERVRRGETLATGLLVTTSWGTNAGVRPRALRSGPCGVTALPSTCPATAGSRTVAEEVRQLRDAIAAAGVTRAQLARLLGVDRRSLSGWVNGDVRPGPERLAALRAVASVIAQMQVEVPGRVPHVLLTMRGESTLLDAAATGAARLESWRTWLQRVEATSSAVGRPGGSAPLWAAAARALADGRLAKPPRQPVIRTPDTYEINPEDEAALFAEPDHQSGRRDYR